MRNMTKIIALFFALLITYLQIGYGSNIISAEQGRTNPTDESIPILTLKTDNVFTFSDQRQSFQTLIENFVRGISQISSPDWFRTNLSIFFDAVMSDNDYLAAVPLLPYKHEVPLIGAPFDYFW